MKRKALIIIALILVTGGILSAQSTSFTYQGRLTDGSSPANGTHSMTFELFDSLSGSSLIASQSATNVSVVNGIFVVSLDFGGGVFDGGDRYLQMTIGGVVLSPRQRVSSTPYAIRATTAGNALNVGGIAADQYVQTTDTRLTDARPPLPGNANYIQNTTSEQASSAFNISGNGTASGTLSANVVNSTTQFNLGGTRIFTTSGADSFGANPFTAVNTFIGDKAGLNTIPNPIPGNTLGKWNSFFGAGAGQSNSQGGENSFFGALAGLANTGGGNSFFGSQAGINNGSGILNTFVGQQAGYRNVGGNTNTFIGVGADFNSDNPNGDGNTLLGIGARVNSGVSNGTAIGGRALVTQSNSVILGSINGVNNATASANVGIGTTAPTERLHVVGNGLINGNLTSTGNLTFQLPFVPSRLSGLSTEVSNTVINFGINNGRQGPFDLLMPGYWVRADNRPGFLGIHFFKKAANTGVETQMMTVNDAGNVGIGTTAPVGNLHINVPSSGSPINAMTVDVQSFQTSANAINSYFFKARDVASGSPPAFLIRGDGNVGIGTSTPSQRLTVSGNASVTGTISGNGSGLTNIGTNNLAGVPSSPGTGIPFLIRFLYNGGTGGNGRATIYDHTTSPAPRNFLIIDVWSINTATNNGGLDFGWTLSKHPDNCGDIGGAVMAQVDFPQTNFGNGGDFGGVTRTQKFNFRVFTASTDDLCISSVPGDKFEVNILAAPLD